MNINYADQIKGEWFFISQLKIIWFNAAEKLHSSINALARPRRARVIHGVTDQMEQRFGQVQSAGTLTSPSWSASWARGYKRFRDLLKV